MVRQTLVSDILSQVLEIRTNVERMNLTLSTTNRTLTTCQSPLQVLFFTNILPNLSIDVLQNKNIMNNILNCFGLHENTYITFDAIEFMEY